MLVNDDLMKCLSENTMSETYHVKTSILFKDKVYENYNIFSVEPISLKDIINFELSKFVIERNWGTFVNYISFDSFDEFIKFKKNIQVNT